jgi:hypothetical protein
MKQNSIELSLLWKDDDGLLGLAIRFSSAMHSLYHETCVYPVVLGQFAEGLKSFPSNPKAAVTLKCGSEDPKFLEYLRLCVFVLKPNGHSVLEIESEVRSDPPSREKCHFFIAGMPADFNRLGASIEAWIQRPNELFRMEWQDG